MTSLANWRYPLIVGLKSDGLLDMKWIFNMRCDISATKEEYEYLAYYKNYYKNYIGLPSTVQFNS